MKESVSEKIISNIDKENNMRNTCVISLRLEIYIEIFFLNTLRDSVQHSFIVNKAIKHAILTIIFFYAHIYICRDSIRFIKVHIFILHQSIIKENNKSKTIVLPILILL